MILLHKVWIDPILTSVLSLLFTVVNFRIKINTTLEDLTQRRYMADLTVDEQYLFAKYWGKELGDEFWADINARYLKSDALLALSAEYNPQTVKRVLSMLDCPPGRCSICCRYPQIHVTQEDIRNIVNNTEHKDIKVKEEKGGYYIDGSNGGCPFLKDDYCTIWKYRPFICYLYPIQGGRAAILNGKRVSQIIIRLNCQSSIDLARKVIEITLKNPEFMLLPDLSVINRYKEP